MEDIKLNKTYVYFDDGKIKQSRMYNVKIVEIIPFCQADQETITQWVENVKECDWLYATETDYFLIGELELPDKTIRIIFVRTKENDWFSLGYWAGRLDTDGSLEARIFNFHTS